VINNKVIVTKYTIGWYMILMVKFEWKNQKLFYWWA